MGESLYCRCDCGGRCFCNYSKCKISRKGGIRKDRGEIKEEGYSRTQIRCLSCSNLKFESSTLPYRDNFVFLLSANWYLLSIVIPPCCQPTFRLAFVSVSLFSTKSNHAAQCNSNTDKVWPVPNYGSAFHYIHSWISIYIFWPLDKTNNNKMTRGDLYLFNWP